MIDHHDFGYSIKLGPVMQDRSQILQRLRIRCFFAGDIKS